MQQPPGYKECYYDYRRYDYTLLYKTGKEKILADRLG